MIPLSYHFHPKYFYRNVLRQQVLRRLKREGNGYKQFSFEIEVKGFNESFPPEKTQQQQTTPESQQQQTNPKLRNDKQHLKHSNNKQNLSPEQQTTLEVQQQQRTPEVKQPTTPKA